MNEIVRFGVFGVIGIFNTMIDIGLWHILRRHIPSYNLSLFTVRGSVVAHCISFLAGALCSFCANSIITFGDKTQQSISLTAAIPFLTVTIFTLMCTTALLHVLTLPNVSHKVILYGSRHVSKTRLKDIYGIAAKLVTVMCGVFINYIGYSLLVFM